MPLKADNQTLSLKLGVPRERVAAYADVLKKVELFASDGFALVDDASNLLLAVMTGVSPEDVADEVEALKRLPLYGAIEASESFEQVRALPLDDPVYVALPPTHGGMVCLAIMEATDAEPTALGAAVYDFSPNSGPGTRRLRPQQLRACGLPTIFRLLSPTSRPASPAR